MNNSHRPHPNIANITLDVILFTEGLINKSPIRFLLDYGAAVSVKKQESLPKQSHSDITETKTSAVTANGSHLNIIGQITLAVSMEQFTCDHTFVVINNLTVDCLLGADFLMKHETILDCQDGRLMLGTHTIPIHEGHSHTAQMDCMAVTLRSNMEISGRTIQLVPCKVSGNLVTQQGSLNPPVQFQDCLSMFVLLGH